VAVTLAPRSGAQDANNPRDQVDTSPAALARIYRADCAVCHGGDGSGSDRGPSIRGVGKAALDYYLSTGRMPLRNPGDTPLRSTPRYPEPVIRALVDYIAALTGGGGPDVPRVDLAHANVANGGVIFRLNCAACHSWAGTGGALSTRVAPTIRPATPQQIADAIRVGPGEMPKFGTAAISDRELADVVAYARYASHPTNRGGAPLSHVGPLAEGAVSIFVALGLLLLFTRWIGTRE
jgi:ubiquinol-cytochrome c reductase cytochrome c subunit